MIKFTLIVFLLLAIRANSQTIDSLDYNSLASFLTLAQKGNKPLWEGTCFFVQAKKTIYLITNNHVVGGEYYTDEFKKLNKNKAPDTLPDNLLIRMYEKRTGAFKIEQIKLFANGKPLYIKFYENEKDTSTLLDVVAIPITGVNNINRTVNGYGAKDIDSSIFLFPSENLFVVGFPQNLQRLYPIWKKGTIASEANLGARFYIDATTRKGMSGSPVVFRGSMVHRKGNENGLDMNLMKTYLIGIYSAQNFESELGVVTKIDKIYEKLLSL